uniref:ribosome-releasing factor 2, mitochondrial n=1 Tax=Myxine glutinosa TaxID=7769 RepID=UPI00358FFA82
MRAKAACFACTMCQLRRGFCYPFPTYSKQYYSIKTGKIKSIRHLPNLDISRIRNIGIMAHIDAGKTTTTERMLYNAGYTRSMGDVDDGDTVTDFMAQERERGITIQSAAVTFHWHDHRINLIDTPGHVDFTMEVERSLRVLDGAVTIFDASAGVEAQTLTVWRQADNYDIPRICFLNKMDKPTASFELSVENIKEKLDVKPIILQLPIGTGKEFRGVVDLVSMDVLTWRGNDGSVYEHQDANAEIVGDLWAEVQKARSALVEQLADMDDGFAEQVLAGHGDKLADVSPDKLRAAVRKVTLARAGVPLLCGSSLKNCGVQPLLDAVVDFLPAPNERQHNFLQWYGNDPVALAFKVCHDQQRGPLVFLRLYGGALSAHSSIFNVSRNCTERLSRLLLGFADQHVEIPQVTAGNIAIAVGLKKTVTGDTLVASKKSAIAASQRTREANTPPNEGSHEAGDIEVILPVLAGVDVPEPVFFCTVEPPSAAKQKNLDHALACLQREDPSLKVHLDPESGQTVLSGMGELHIEIIQDRIRREYGIEAYLGPLQVAYRETTTRPGCTTVSLERHQAEMLHSVSVELFIQPQPGAGPVCISWAPSEGPVPRPEIMESVQSGIESGASQGPILGYPVQDVHVCVQSITVNPSTSLAILSACTVQCLHKALLETGGQILEPLMMLEILVPEEHLSFVLADLAQRRGSVLSIHARRYGQVVSASVPLADMMGYSTTLRTLTSGTASFSLEPSGYKSMSPLEQRKLIQERKGP